MNTEETILRYENLDELTIDDLRTLFLEGSEDFELSETFAKRLVTSADKLRLSRAELGLACLSVVNVILIEGLEHCQWTNSTKRNLQS